MLNVIQKQRLRPDTKKEATHTALLGELAVGDCTRLETIGYIVDYKRDH